MNSDVMNTHESKLILMTEVSDAGEELQPAVELGGGEEPSADASNRGSKPDAHAGGVRGETAPAARTAGHSASCWAHTGEPDDGEGRATPTQPRGARSVPAQRSRDGAAEGNPAVCGGGQGSAAELGEGYSSLARRRDFPGRGSRLLMMSGSQLQEWWDKVGTECARSIVLVHMAGGGHREDNRD